MHFHLPKPLHGWREFVGEVGIIVIGVLIALGAEQIVENWRWHREADHAIESLRDEISDHYFAASEAMIAVPCIDAQLNLLEQRLLQPGAYAPAPMFSDNQIDYVVRMPDRLWSDNVWRSVQSEGAVSHLPTNTRLGLGSYYAQVVSARENNVATKLLDYRLRVLARPVALDEGSRMHVLEEIEETRGRVKEQAVYSSQMLRKAEDLKLALTPKELADALTESGTLRFCRIHHLPLGNNRAVL